MRKSQVRLWFLTSIFAVTIAALPNLAASSNSSTAPHQVTLPSWESLGLIPDPNFPIVPFFDFDNTVGNLISKIMVFKKNADGSRDTLPIGTADWVLVKHLVANQGNQTPFKLGDSEYNLSQYAFDPDPDTGSLVQFRSHPNGPEYFVDHMKLAFGQAPQPSAMAPMFWYFIKALNDPAIAARTVILTARGHSLEEFKAGLDILRNFVKVNFGIDTYPMKDENIIQVGAAQNPSAEKEVQIIARLDQLQAEAAADTHHWVQWFFTDDDPDNVDSGVSGVRTNETPVDGAGTPQLKDRWNHVIRRVIYDGPNDLRPGWKTYYTQKLTTRAQCLESFQ